MKKSTLFLLSTLIAVSMTACASSGSTGGTALVEPATQETQKENTSQESDAGTQQSQNTSGRILVAYFTAAENSDVDARSSASVTEIDGEAKGNVQAIADEIAAYTGGDLFSIQTSVEYPGNIDDLIDYAQDEQDADERPELTTHIENLDQYDTIFIGYPTWWYDLPQVMYSFFDEYDFSGKTIVPFNSANGSRFSGTIGTIQQLEPDADVITEGLSVHQNNVSNAKSEVEKWLKGLGY
jgi:flavodoxin